jgi:hypothetical protein
MNNFSYTKHILYINDNEAPSGVGAAYASQQHKKNTADQKKYTADLSVYFGLEDTDLFPFIVTRENAKRASADELAEGAVSANGFIRWDALCHLFNKHFIPINDKDGLPLFVLSCTQLINEDLPIIEKVTELGDEVKAGKHMSPILMAKVNNPLATRIIGGITTALDNSLDPTVCLAPHQHKEALNNERAEKLIRMFTQHGIVPAVGDQKLAKDFDKMINYKLSDHEKRYYIGHMLLNVNRLYQTYKSMKYDEEGAIKKDFSLWDYIKKIWEDVNDAGGNNHDFKITSDLERPNIVRIVDMRYQENKNLKPEDIIELNIQSNDSIVRDFSFNTSIPSAMSATISTAAQAPKNVDSLEAASFGAFHKNISNRFATFSEPEETVGKTEEEIRILHATFDNDLKTYKNGLRDLSEHLRLILEGEYMVAAEGGESIKSEEVGKMKGLVNAVRRASENLIKMYPEDRGKHYKGEIIKNVVSQPTSAIIPLKFNATLDGISGIIIGNVFKLPNSRLPRGYKDANIAFVAMTEDQTITSGQDWTTKITGQMIILPKNTQVIGSGDGWDAIDFNQYNEEIDSSNQYREGGNEIDNEQKQIDEGMDAVRIGSKVYLKINEGHTHVRASAIIDNEGWYDTDNNIIGLFKPGNGGLLLGEIIEATNTKTYVMVQGKLDDKSTKDKNESTSDKYYWADADGNPDLNREVPNNADGTPKIANDAWPWYKIQFTDYAAKQFSVGDTYDPTATFDNYDDNSADERDQWEEPSTKHQGWMRLDVLQSKA